MLLGSWEILVLFSFLVKSLSGFGIEIVLSSWNELGNVPVPLFSGKDAKGIETISPLNVC